MKKSHLLQIIMLLAILTFTVNPSIAQDNPQLPQTTGDGTLRRLRVPILMYHYVSALPPDADDIRIGLTVEPQLFREHMQYLQTAGYQTVSLYETHLALEFGTPLPPKPVILTFDDGYIDHYSTVFPLLQEYGFTGTFFIISQFVDNNHPAYMSWEQIAQMANAGMNMEAHTKTHADLRLRNHDFLIFEIMGSVESIGYHTGIEPHIFAYPIGRYDDMTLNVLGTTDILRAVTTQPGVFHTTDNRLLLPRMRVNNDTSVLGLQGLLNYQG
jgi:peptidoglycan/xylan/chitin deacetylase (PgdA/CDA1 family)